MNETTLDQTMETTKKLERGYGSTSLDRDFIGMIPCPAKDGCKKCSAMLTFQIKSLEELSTSNSGEIQKCSNPDGLDEHRVLIFMGKNDGNEFPFAQATHMTEI